MVFDKSLPGSGGPLGRFGLRRGQQCFCLRMGENQQLLSVESERICYTRDQFERRLAPPALDKGNVTGLDSQFLGKCALREAQGLSACFQGFPKFVRIFHMSYSSNNARRKFV